MWINKWKLNECEVRTDLLRSAATVLVPELAINCVKPSIQHSREPAGCIRSEICFLNRLDPAKLAPDQIEVSFTLKSRSFEGKKRWNVIESLVAMLELIVKRSIVRPQTIWILLRNEIPNSFELCWPFSRSSDSSSKIRSNSSNLSVKPCVSLSYE